MTCDEAREMFSEFYDGKLDEETAARFETHKQACPDCAANYESFFSTMAAVQALPEPTPPEGFHDILMDRIRALRPRSPRSYARLSRFLAHPFRSRAPWKVYAQAAGWAAVCFIVLSATVAGISGVAEMAGLRHGNANGESNVNSVAFEATYEAHSRQNDAYDAYDTPEVHNTYGESGATVPQAKLALITDSDAESDAESSAESGVDLSAANARVNAFKTAVGDDASLMLAAGYFEQTFTINIIVDDLDTAMAVVERLDGYNLNADKRHDDRGGGYGSYRRRVEVAAYAGVKETLRTLGEVTDESENVVRHADDVFDLEARLAAKEEECKRLTALLTQSRTMDVLVAVERQLSTAESEREDLRGRLNQLYDISARPYINISLYERPPEPEAIPDDTFAERLHERFIRSMNGFIIFVENVVVLISGAFVPMVVVAVFIALVYAAHKRRKRRRKAEIPLSGEDDAKGKEPGDE